MTREEAARIINECKDKGFKHTFYTLNEYHTALDMAIKALEQEPCDDAISRQAVKEHMIKYGFHAPDMTVTEFVEDLPSVSAEKVGKWKHFAWSDDCSECGWSTGKYGSPTKYCPNCGARMKFERR